MKARRLSKITLLLLLTLLLSACSSGKADRIAQALANRLTDALNIAGAGKEEGRAPSSSAAGAQSPKLQEVTLTGAVALGGAFRFDLLSSYQGADPVSRAVLAVQNASKYLKIEGALRDGHFLIAGTLQADTELLGQTFTLDFALVTQSGVVGEYRSITVVIAQADGDVEQEAEPEAEAEAENEAEPEVEVAAEAETIEAVEAVDEEIELEAETVLRASKLDLGMAHACALMSDASLWCWGKNEFGQLGDGTTTPSPLPVQVKGLTNGQDLATGASFSCGLTSGGAVLCWGVNSEGQLGNGDTTSKPTPQAVGGLTSGVVQIASGDSHSCALTSTGPLVCWGKNDSGQLGDGTTTNQPTPVQMNGLSTGISALGLGYPHSCAVIDGGLKCWGRNDQTQLGAGSSDLCNQFACSKAPLDVTNLTAGVVAVGGGDGNTCAVLSSGAVQCWGWNNHCQLGQGTDANARSTPTTVLGLESGVRPWPLAGRAGPMISPAPY